MGGGQSAGTTATMNATSDAYDASTLPALPSLPEDLILSCGSASRLLCHSTCAPSSGIRENVASGALAGFPKLSLASTGRRLFSTAWNISSLGGGVLVGSTYEKSLVLHCVGRPALGILYPTVPWLEINIPNASKSCCRCLRAHRSLHERNGPGVDIVATGTSGSRPSHTYSGLMLWRGLSKFGQALADGSLDHDVMSALETTSIAKDDAYVQEIMPPGHPMWFPPSGQRNFFSAPPGVEFAHLCTSVRGRPSKGMSCWSAEVPAFPSSHSVTAWFRDKATSRVVAFDASRAPFRRPGQPSLPAPIEPLHVVTLPEGGSLGVSAVCQARRRNLILVGGEFHSLFAVDHRSPDAPIRLFNTEDRGISSIDSCGESDCVLLGLKRGGAWLVDLRKPSGNGKRGTDIDRNNSLGTCSPLQAWPKCSVEGGSTEWRSVFAGKNVALCSGGVRVFRRDGKLVGYGEAPNGRRRDLYGLLYAGQQGGGDAASRQIAAEDEMERIKCLSDVEGLFLDGFGGGRAALAMRDSVQILVWYSLMSQ